MNESEQPDTFAKQHAAGTRADKATHALGFGGHDEVNRDKSVQVQWQQPKQEIRATSPSLVRRPKRTRKRLTATAVQATQPKAAVKKPERFLKILVYGVSGSGKTRLAMSSLDVESMRRVLVLDVERGLIGIDPSPHWDSVAVNSLNDAESAVDRISQYKTVVIDSVTRLSRMSTTSFANSRTGGRPNDEVRQEDYGKTLRRVGAMLDYLQRAPINLIVIAGMKFVYAADSTPGNPKYKEILPDLDGKLLSRAQETADMVWPLLEQSGHTGLLTLNKEPYRVKSRRLLAMGEGKPVNQAGVVVDATMDKIWQAFQDSFTTPQ